jgi:hypothetical protein
MGEHRGKPLGSRLAMPAAKAGLTNYLTENIRGVVRREVLDPVRSRGKLYGKPRIFNDLLSSQPLCFNLFGELQLDLDLASRVFRRLTAGRVHEVTAVGFEHSPGSGDVKYTGDRSAFDVFVQYVTAEGERGFAAIEVKYHEDLSDKPATHKARYDEVASAMACFHPDAFVRLKQKPLQQIWRDHLLMGSLLQDVAEAYADGFFVFLYPEGNERCAAAVEAYRGCLRSTGSFVAWTLEGVVAALEEERGGAWVEAVRGRYLGAGRIAG